MEKEKIIKVGLIKGRHPLPVNNYIFNDTIENVNDFNSIESHIKNWINSNITITNYYGTGLNQLDYSDVKCVTSEEELVVYLTGLSQVTTSLLKVCISNGIKLTLMHYDTNTNSYISQKII